jgi:hypothetical protein
VRVPGGANLSRGAQPGGLSAEEQRQPLGRLQGVERLHGLIFEGVKMDQIGTVRDVPDELVLAIAGRGSLQEEEVRFGFFEFQLHARSSQLHEQELAVVDQHGLDGGGAERDAVDLDSDDRHVDHVQVDALTLCPEDVPREVGCLLERRRVTENLNGSRPVADGNRGEFVAHVDPFRVDSCKRQQIF